MAKRINQKVGIEVIGLSLPLENISIGDIIKDYWRDKLITELKGNKLKTLMWFKDSLPSKIAEETYEIFRGEKGDTFLHLIKYHRPNPSTKNYNLLIKKLEKAGI